MNNIELYSNFTKFLCELLNLRTPTIYIIKYEKNNIVLYDNKLNIISYDERDVGEMVKEVSIILKQNTLYINSKYALDTMKTLILIAKRLRFMYQVKQSILFKNGENIEVEESLANQWVYEFTPSRNKKRQPGNNQITPAELDRKAFAKIIIGVLFKYNIHFQIETGLKDNERGYNETIHRIRKTYPKELIELTVKKDMRMNDILGNIKGGNL